MLPRNKIEEIKQIARIEQLIGDYITVKKAGRSYKAKCPFHDDTKPSLHINPEMGIYKCFVCDAGGDIFKFLMDYNHMAFLEAVETVANRFHIILPDDYKTDKKQRLTLEQQALKTLWPFYRQQFEDNVYQIHKSAIGYVNPDCQNVGYIGLQPTLDYARHHNIKSSILREIGLINLNGTDLFHGCLVFPICSATGTINGFYGFRDTDNLVTNCHSRFIPHCVVYGLEQRDRSKRIAWLMKWPWQAELARSEGVPNPIAVMNDLIHHRQAEILSRYFDTIVYGETNIFNSSVFSSISRLIISGINLRLTNGSGDIEHKDWLAALLGQNRHTKQLYSLFTSLIACIPDRLTRNIYIQHLYENFKYNDTNTTA